MGKSKSQLQEDIAKFDALINKSTTSEEQKKVFRTIKAKAEAKLETIDKEAPKKAEPKPKETTPKGAKTTIDGDEYIIDKFRDGSSAEYNNYKIYENKSGFWDEIKKPETKKDLINSTKRKVATPPVKKPAAKKKTTKKKPAAKKKTVAKKSTTTKGGNTGSFAKLRASIAKRDGLTYKQALPIAKKEYAAQKESLMSSKKAKSETRLSAYKRKYKGRGTEDVKESGSMRALDVEKDAKIPALKRGKRTSKGTGANQYGKAKKGGIYYENRSNRSDVRQPSKTVAPPKLAKGGTTKGQTLAENFNLKDEVKSVEFWNNDVIVKDKLGKIKRIDLDKGERISLKAEGGRINIVNEGEKFDKKKYKGALGDFDKDGVANIDDSRPLVNTGKKETVEQVELAKTFDKLLKLKAQLDSTMNVTVDELDKVAPKGAQIYARTKTPYSILNKLVEKRLLDKNKGLNDLVGTTIAVDNYKDLRAVDSKIRSGTIGKVIEVEDMYDAPKGGYRAVHYLVESDGYIIEVQLKTKRQKDVNVLSHDAYKKGTLNKQFLLDLTDLANKADKGEGDAEKEFSKLMKDKKALEKRLDSSFGFGGEIARSYDVNINSGVGTYAKGGDVKYEDPRAVRLWNERGYDGNYLGKLSEKELQRLFDTEFYFELNETEYAKGGFIQKAVENMKEKGTVGAFTKQANRREMTPVDFAKMVLKTPDAYSETTRKRAQFVKNANPELFSFGGEIARSYDVNINSGVGTYAKGGITEAGDTDFPSELLNYAKGGRTQETLEPNELQDLGYRHGEDAVNKIPKSIFHQPQFMEYVSAYVKQFYDYAEVSKDFDVNNYAKGGSLKRSNNSPMLRYVNFEDGWHINLKKLKSSMNQNGKPYKGNNKYGISRQGRGQEQEIWEFETLNEATTKYNELVKLGKTYSKIDKQGEVKSNYAKGGEVKFKEVSAKRLKFLLKLKRSENLDTLTDYKVDGQVYFIAYGSGKDLNSNNLYLFKKTNSGNKPLRVVTTSYQQGGELMDADTQVDYAKGGKMYYQDDLPPLIIFSFDDKYDADSFFNDAKYSMPDNDIVRLSDNSIQFIGSRQDADFLSQRAESYNSYDKFAKGGKTEAKVYNVEIILQSDEDSWATDILPFAVTKSQAKRIADKINRMKPKSAKAEIPLPFAKGGKTQGYNSRLDESLGNRTGAEVDFEQKNKDRRDESKAMEKSMGKRAYSSVRTMDKMAKGGDVGQNGYIAMYKGKKIEVYADSSYAAQKKAAEMFNAKKSYDVNVYLAEKDGKTVMQSTMFGEGGRSKSRDDMFLSQEKHEQEYAKKRKKKVSYKKRK